MANEEEALNLRAFEASPVAAALHSFLTRDLGGGHALLFRSLAASARAESSEMAMPAGGCVFFFRSRRATGPERTCRRGCCWCMTSDNHGSARDFLPRMGWVLFPHGPTSGPALRAAGMNAATSGAGVTDYPQVKTPPTPPAPKHRRRSSVAYSITRARLRPRVYRRHASRQPSPAAASVAWRAGEGDQARSRRSQVGRLGRSGETACPSGGAHTTQPVTSE